MVSTTRVQRLQKLVVLLTFTLSLTLVAQASVLGVGGTAPPTPLAPSGTLLATTSGTITTPTFSADYTAWVFSDPNNTWCSGCLDFVYEFTNNGLDPNERYSMSSFAGFNVDVGNSPFGIHDPNTVSRSVSLNGSVISFNYDQFGNDVLAGETTAQLVIMTDARYFTSGFLSAQDGTAGSGVAYQPSAVPEPTSLFLLGSGVLAVGGILRRTRLK
jgi:hypothetical protein